MKEHRSGRLEEILVCCANHVRFADNGCLQNNQVVYVSDGRCKHRVERNYLGSLPQEFDEIVYLRFRQPWMAITRG